MKLHESIKDTRSINKYKNLLIDFEKTHGSKYNYTKSIFKGMSTPINIICKEHGEFGQTPIKHKNGRGCTKCGIIKRNKNNTLNRSDLLKSFIEKHGNSYDYSKMVYKGAHKKVVITCKKHGDFTQTPNSHKTGSGCPLCYIEKTAKETYTNRKTILYYIKVNGLYKIGVCLHDKRYKDIENNIIKGRYRNKVYNELNLKVLDFQVFENGYEAYLKEQHILSSFEKYRYINFSNDMNWFGGYTELFNEDIRILNENRLFK